MKILPRFGSLMLLLTCCSTGALAQRKTVRPRVTGAPPAAAKKADPRLDAAGRVAEQVKTLTKFLYLFGGVSKDLATADAAIKRGEASRDAAARARQNKAALLSSLQNVRDGLDKLEADFRFTPQLQTYYPQLKGVANAAAEAEDLAANGEYEDAGRALVDVAQQLTDVLLAMR